MNKILHPFDQKMYDGKFHPVFIRVQITEGRLSITGVQGPRQSGNAWGGCGQIDMEYAHRNPADNDPRYTDPIHAHDLRFATHWNAIAWWGLLEIWKKRHLNDMQAACEHQRALGWKYDTHHDLTTGEGEACPTCGYKIGSQWLKSDIPMEVIAFLESLPETDRTPAWV